jgi:hypothetical protein
MFVSSSFDGDTSVSIVTNKKPEIFRFNGDVILKARADLSGQFVQVTLSLDDLVEIYSFMTPELILKVHQKILESKK